MCPYQGKLPRAPLQGMDGVIKIFGFWPFFSFSNGLILPAPRAECPTCVSRGRGDIRHTQWQEALIPSVGTNNLGVWRWISAPPEEGQHLPLQSAPLVRKPTSGGIYTSAQRAHGSYSCLFQRLSSLSAGVFAVFQVQVHFVHCKNIRQPQFCDWFLLGEIRTNVESFTGDGESGSACSFCCPGYQMSIHT